MAEENTNPPVETQAQPAEQPMMKFSDLEALVDQNEGQPQEDKGIENVGQEQPPVEQAGQVVEDPVAKLLSETGFKSVEELARSQKEGHATITKLSQERAALQRDMEALANFPQMLAQQVQNRPQSPVQQQPQGQPDSLTLELFKDMAPFMDQLIEQRLMEKAPLIVDQKLSMKELGSKVQAKRAENPEEFDDLRPIMQNILRERPQYEAHPDGLNVIYEMAKQARDNRIANITSKIFGEDIPLDKLREAMKMVMAGQSVQQQQPQQQVQPVAPSGYVPPSSANTPPMTQRPTNFDSEISSRMKGKLSPQTVDEITDLWWQKVMTGTPTENTNRRSR
jgi:hypothetical protein